MVHLTDKAPRKLHWTLCDCARDVFVAVDPARPVSAFSTVKHTSQKVYVDGTRVLARSGYVVQADRVKRLPWRRRKNKTYEIDVTKDIFEVKRGERRVWGLDIG